MERDLDRVRKEYYTWNKLEQIGKSSQDVCLSSHTAQLTTPTWLCPAVEDDVDHMDIETIMKESRESNRAVVFSGTDYGVVKMSETVPVTQQRLEDHFQYFKKAHDPTVEVPRRVSHVPESSKITAAQINSISHSRRMQRRREKRLKGDEAVKKAYETISQSQNSMVLATTLNEISDAHAARREIRDIVRPFETSRQRIKDIHTQRLRTERCWQKLGSAERRHIQDAVLKEAQDHARSSHSSGITKTSTNTNLPSPDPPAAVVSAVDGWCALCSMHHTPNRPKDKMFVHMSECSKQATDILPVMLIGDAGTGVGLRIGGHTRRGGKKLRQEHMKHCVAVLTDEFKTSKTCCYCFEPVAQARGRRIIHGQEKMVKVHGALECTNRACPSVQIGYTIKARDPHAALAIALAGAPSLRSPTRRRLGPFSRYAIENHQ
ncbi:unnamed protein product [Mortierella alpina]